MSDWAKEQILERIAKATESSADSLSRMLTGSAAGLGQLNKGLGEAGEAAEDNAKKSRGLGKAIKDLYGTLTREKNWEERNREWRSQRFRQFGSELTNSSNMLQRFGSGLVGGLDRFAVIGPVLGLFAGATVGLIQNVMGAKDAFIGLVDTGIMFNGSLVDFRVAMGNAGLTAEQFGAIVAQSGQAIQIFGERRFLDSTNRLRVLFDELGLNVSQGNEYFAEYLENSRLSGTLYLQTQEEQRQGFEENLRQMREQARLTGVSLRQQRDQQRALQQDLEYRVLLRSVTPERATYIRRQEAQITPIAGAEFAREFMTYAERGILRPGGFMAVARQMGIGQQLDELARRSRQGEQLDPQEFQQAIMSVPRQLFDTLLTSLYGRDRNLAERFMAMREAAEARQGIPGARGTQGGLDRPTQAMITAQNNLNLLLSRFNAAMVSLGSAILPLVLPALEGFNSALEGMNSTLQDFTSAQPGEGLESIARNLDAGETTMNILRSFREQGVLAGIGTAISAAFSSAYNRLTTILENAWTSLIRQLETWRDQFIQALENLPIIRWFRDGGPAEIAESRRSRERAITAAQQAATASIVPPTASPMERLAALREERSSMEQTAEALRQQQMQQEMALFQNPTTAERNYLAEIINALRIQNELLALNNRETRNVERAIQQGQ